MPVAHGLAERHQIRNDAVLLVAPHVPPDATETALHFVRDVQAAGLAHQFDGTPHEAGGTFGSPSLENSVQMSIAASRCRLPASDSIAARTSST